MEEETDRHMWTSWHRCLGFVGLFLLFVVNGKRAEDSRCGCYDILGLAPGYFPVS